MQFRIIVQAAAAKPFVPIGDRPTDHIAKRVMIEVQIERDIVVEAYILCIDRVTVYYTRCKRDDPAALAPKEETDLVPHPAPQIAEILLRQLLEVQLRSPINLEIQWIDLRDYRRRVVDDAQFEWGGSCRRLKFLA